MKSKPIEISFTPADNLRLANLCGALDENLKQIETALDVTIARRGEHFSLSGQADQIKLAAQVLRNFYNQSQHYLSIEQVQLGLIQAINPHHLPDPTNTDALATSKAAPALMTRRSNLYGRTPRQAQYLQQIQEHDITFAIGPAGTGKTYLAVASAVDALERDMVARLILVRPAVEAGERLGFLPGDMTQKVDPYLRPLYDALYDLMGFDKTSKQFDRNTIEIAPLAFMRGRTLNQSFIILDEAQNTTPEQMKMFLTRIGFGSKAVITGDITQTDLPKHQKSGLVEAKQVLNQVRGIAFTHFKSEDVVRHPLVQRIVNAYESYDEQKRDD
ncbi:phosphate starvation-inducible protein PhoH [Nitrosomonas cryotolerans]|uniref:PhoH-like protein n=1 Tax=Nitrosomonas cryotolerans ATCC 49181 TaxID=1131553 RepID=A0A1N6GRX3_9PROT|nr:PhoH family protein [Nitrosomonas cryotolerans]SFP40120.1 phosphate starvation-inducible protein PhoH [Nitrosomonas cryotolerans]SIO10233.1 phosphate starvation-inducible protein PhoH [Nitrosomonas cryotolerans ATCC 49181]